MGNFVYGDVVHYVPQGMDFDPLPVTVVSVRVRFGRRAARQVEDPFGAVWPAWEDELSHPAGQKADA